ncbi:unnamed protein product [Prunus brigantina]
MMAHDDVCCNDGKTSSFVFNDVVVGLMMAHGSSFDLWFPLFFGYKRDAKDGEDAHHTERSWERRKIIVWATKLLLLLLVIFLSLNCTQFVFPLYS